MVNKYWIFAVSYTHLDVYKRQNYIITSYYQNDDNNDIAVFVFEKEGQDNNKPCTIKQTFEMHNDSFSIIKKVKYKDSDLSLIHI